MRQQVVAQHSSNLFSMLWSTLTLVRQQTLLSSSPSSQPLIFSQGVSPLGRNHRVLVAVVTAAVIVAVVVDGRGIVGVVVVRRLADAVENLGIVGAELVL